MSKRYEAWAGLGTTEGLEAVIKTLEGIEVSKPYVDAIWPIVDTWNCGVIDGYPKIDQIAAFTLTAEMQRHMVDILNAGYGR